MRTLNSPVETLVMEHITVHATMLGGVRVTVQFGATTLGSFTVSRNGTPCPLFGNGTYWPELSDVKLTYKSQWPIRVEWRDVGRTTDEPTKFPFVCAPTVRGFGSILYQGRNDAHVMEWKISEVDHEIQLY